MLPRHQHALSMVAEIHSLQDRWDPVQAGPLAGGEEVAGAVLAEQHGSWMRWESGFRAGAERDKASFTCRFSFYFV